ncbi:MAG: hypothetical protein K2N94_09555 [Lachnospiraceae bacterium]|nr:hypothetical protein [Lachnospiraceae bacterium]
MNANDIKLDPEKQADLRGLDLREYEPEAYEPQKDYSKYFKIIIALLLIPYIVKLITFLVGLSMLGNLENLFEKVLNGLL